MVRKSENLTRLERAEAKRQPWRNSWQIIRDIEDDGYFYQIHQDGPNICGLFEGGRDEGGRNGSFNEEWAIPKTEFLAIARDLNHIDDFSETQVYDRVTNHYRPGDDEPIRVDIDAWFSHICSGTNQEIFSEVIRAWFADQKSRAIETVCKMKDGAEWDDQFLALQFLANYFRYIKPDCI